MNRFLIAMFALAMANPAQAQFVRVTGVGVATTPSGDISREISREIEAYLKLEATARAVANARAQAQRMAEASDMTLGRMDHLELLSDRPAAAVSLSNAREDPHQFMIRAGGHRTTQGGLGDLHHADAQLTVRVTVEAEFELTP